MDKVLVGQLQDEQQKHDVVSHWDIITLGTAGRLRHLVLHFSKYVGRLAGQLDADQKIESQLVTDVAIISLSLANAMNADLAREAPIKPIKSDLAFVLGLATSTGKMAKALESLDHLEAFEYRESLEQGAREIFYLCLAIQPDEEEFVSRIKGRWKRVEQAKKFRNGPI
jgi:hypothetical protein